MSSDNSVIVRETRYSAPAAACAAQMLKLLARTTGPQNLADITRSIGSTKSLAFRVARELEEAELITKVGSQGYQLGVGALELGAAVATRSEYVEVLRDILKDLAERVGETVNIGVLREADVLFIMKQEAPYRVVTISHIGQRLPANTSALGKILLSQLTDDEIVERLPNPLPRLTPQSISNVDDLLRDIREARTVGFAVDRGGSILGRSALAISISLPQLGPDPAGLAVTASADEFEERIPQLLEALLQTRSLAERGSTARLAMQPIETNS